LWDIETDQMVSNESSEIIQMFNDAFNDITSNQDDYFHQHDAEALSKINDRIYHHVNNGVYKAGFATTQKSYEDAVIPLFETLDWLNDRLTERKFLLGDLLSEADVRLFTTLIRFDPVYHGHFKCNRQRLIDYPYLAAYTRALFEMPAFRDTTNFQHIKQHYYGSHPTLNPTGIVPVGPDEPC
jgi:glutathionyl-hydroquinone reductase